MVECSAVNRVAAGSSPAPGAEEFMNNDSYPCTCKHDRGHHRGIGMMPKNQHCWVFECSCKGYKADNLLYLEQKDYERNSK